MTPAGLIATMQVEPPETQLKYTELVDEGLQKGVMVANAVFSVVGTPNIPRKRTVLDKSFDNSGGFAVENTVPLFNGRAVHGTGMVITFAASPQIRNPVHPVDLVSV